MNETQTKNLYQYPQRIQPASKLGTEPVAPLKLSFEYGTLVLEPCPSAFQKSFFIFDQRTQCFRAPAYRYAEVCAALKAQNWAVSDQVATLFLKNDMSAFLRDVPLRPYQKSCFDEWLALKRACLILPTGSGKTQIALSLISFLKVPCLILVPTRILLEQWLQKLRSYYAGPLGCLGDGQYQMGWITVSTFESAFRHMGRIGAQFQFLIVDECHHFGNKIRDEALKMCTAPYRLGLTATFPSALEAQKELEDLLGFVAAEISFQDLSESFMAPFEYFSIPCPLNASERLMYEKEMKIFTNFLDKIKNLSPTLSFAELSQLAAQTEEGREALKAWNRAKKLVFYCESKRRTLAKILQMHAQNPSIVFTAENESTYKIAHEFLIYPFSSEIGKKERNAILKDFAEGRIRHLVSCKVMNEGYDVPQCQVAIIMGGSGGKREHVQRIGRVLRPFENKKASIFELISPNTFELKQSRKRRL